MSFIKKKKKNEMVKKKFSDGVSYGYRSVTVSFKARALSSTTHAPATYMHFVNFHIRSPRNFAGKRRKSKLTGEYRYLLSS